MAFLRVALFGGLTAASAHTGPINIPASCKPIIGYLIVHRERKPSRTEVAEMLWQERDSLRARRCLSTALWRLKQTIPSVHLVDGSSASEDLALNWSLPGWVDVVAFQQRADKAMAVPAERLSRRELHRMRRAVDLYRGDLLQGMDDEWVLIERQRLRNIYLDLLLHLAQGNDHHGDTHSALMFARRLSALDPLREDVHRLIMQLYVKVGNRAKAIEQYRICQGELGAELGVDPTLETQSLFRSIMGPAAEPAISTELRASTTLSITKDQLVWVRRALAASDKRLANSIELLERVQKTGGSSGLKP